jgi:hypothetical protein
MKDLIGLGYHYSEQNGHTLVAIAGVTIGMVALAAGAGSWTASK